MLNSKLNFITINFGPQHPATHGVLRLILKVCGEVVLQANPHIGYLHRGTEKLLESKTYLQVLPYFDRLDYVTMMSSEHAFSLAIETLLGLNIPLRAKAIRVMFLELTRILNHLLALGSCALDLGAMTVLLWFFEEREKLMEIYERVSGARMHANYIRPGGVREDLPLGVLEDITTFCVSFKERLLEVDTLLTGNRIWKQRLVDVGIISKKDALDLGLTGVLLRSTGIAYDVRARYPYELYNKISFKVICGRNGDCYDRYLMRIEEMLQSIFIIQQCYGYLREGPIRVSNSKIFFDSRSIMKGSMESLIKHFKIFSEGFAVPNGECYVSTEAPKGELGIYLVSNGSTKPYRCHVRAPGFVHLHSIDHLTRGHYIADTISLIGTLDIVFGEIDR